jgi:hypothetical protein
MAIFCIVQLLSWLVELRIQAYISGHSQGVRAIPGQSEEGKDRKQCHPVQCEDAGSIEKYGTELTMILVMGLDAAMRPTCYDSPHSGIKSAPFRSGLRWL